MQEGAKISHYEIRKKIGSGGMGEVYRALDVRLQREVAIKVLPADLADDEDRLRRFKQEAEATSALNHPNILTVYDIGEHAGTPFIVSELLEGEELRQRLDEGPIPLRKVTEYAQHIVSGLTAAHEKGIVHRDLKPENLFITKDDRVKILDFGLAKLRAPDAGAHSSEDATLRAITNPGVIMGTVGYMSPEQVRGHLTDHRSDIFSFGTILHEMITGRRAFQHETMAETMSAILKEEPEELAESNPNISPSLERIVRRCLEKKAERRFQSTADLGFALEALSERTSSLGSGFTTTASTGVEQMRRSAWRGRIGWLIAGVFLLGLLVALPFALGYLRQSPPVQAVPISFSILAPEKATQLLTPAISPDGRTFIFTVLIDGKGELWQRSMGLPSIQALPGVVGLQGSHTWSPDSRSIAFAAEGKLKKLDLCCGTSQPLCSLPEGASTGDGATTWSRDGVILFQVRGKIYRVPATGGEAQLVLGSEKPEALYQWPSFLPDGRHFLFHLTDKQQDISGIYLASLDDNRTTRLFAADSQAIYSASATGTGYLLYARGRTLVGQPFDAGGLKLTGEPFVVVEPFSVTQNSRGMFSVSDSGILVYYSGSIDDNQQLTWVDRAGKLQGTLGTPGTLDAPTISPEGRHVSFSRKDDPIGTHDIFVTDLTRGVSSRFTFDNGDDRHPNWSSDGSHISWQSARNGSYQIFQKAVSGVGEDELLYSSESAISFDSWSPDGRFMLLDRFSSQSKLDLWVLPLEGDRQPYPYLQAPFNERGGQFSPNGRWVAYTSDESGRSEVFVQSFPASAAKLQISTDGGSNARWRGDGKELFYISGDNKLASVEIRPDGVGASAPKVLFDLAFLRRVPTYAVAADGQRFLFVTQGQVAANLQYNVMVNWAADIKK